MKKFRKKIQKLRKRKAARSKYRQAFELRFISARMAGESKKFAGFLSRRYARNITTKMGRRYIREIAGAMRDISGKVNWANVIP